MYVDLWGWFRQYEYHALSKGDSTRRRLVTLAREGWRYREAADADRAILTFKQAATIATQLNEPCWVLFHNYWVAEMMFYLQHDYQGTLDYIIRLTAEARKDLYETCPVRSRVFFVLANIYYMIDFYGYEQQVIDVLDYIENEVIMDKDTHMRVLHMRAQIHFDYDRFDDAESQTQEMLNRTPFNAFRQRSGYHMLRAIAYAKGDVQLAYDYADIAEDYAMRIQIQRSIAEGKLWKAVYLQRLNRLDDAYIMYKKALNHYDRYNLPKEVAFHDASSEFAELNGEVDEAIAHREQLITQTASSASLYNQMVAQWQYLRTLGRLGKSLDTALANAKSLATNMQNPTVYLQKITDIEQGNYYEYPWQAEV